MRKHHLAATIAAALAASVTSTSAQQAIELRQLNGDNGFVLVGIDGGDFSGKSVGGTGDINGDGIDDLIIGAYGVNGSSSNEGATYVVFGKTSDFSDSLGLASLNGNNGFALTGIDTNDSSGRAVSGAGDINGDGTDDLIIGAFGAYPNGPGSGESYVVFGSSNGFSASLSLNDLDGDNGFVINGIKASDRSGYSVSDAGDVNGDGIDDLIIGANRAELGSIGQGQSYVVFGDIGGFPTALNLISLNGSNGFALNGDGTNDQAGQSVSGAGDINGDGMDDVIIGAPRANGITGQTYVVFGFDNSAVLSIGLSGLNGSNGFVLNGIEALDGSGNSVSAAGDVNGDGIDDLIIGASGANAGANDAGQAYVVYGSTGGFSPSLDLSTLNGSNGFMLNGIAAVDRAGAAVSSAGDPNGDGFDDVLVSAVNAGDNNSYIGETYLVFGSSDVFPSSLNLATLNGSNGLVLRGIDDFDNSGDSVSGAGDVNGDGIDDIIIGTVLADPGVTNAGETYLVFGNAAPKAVGSLSLLFEELEDDTDPAGSRLDFSVAAQYLDVDPFGGMAVVADASTAGQGQWEYSSDATTWTAVPSSLSDSSALVLNAETLLRFVSTSNFSGRPGALTARLWDGRWREPGTSVDIINAIGALGGFARDEDLLQVTLDITPVNDAPSFTAASPPTVNEDPGGVTVSGWSTFNPGPNEAGQFALVYQVVNISNPGLFSVLPTIDTAGDLVYNPAPDVSGASSFDVRVVDNGGIANGGVDVSGFQTFSVTVNPVNDPPAFVGEDPPAVTIDSGPQVVANWASIDAGAPDERNQQVSLLVSGLSNPALFSTPPSIDGTGNLSYTPATGVSGISTYTVTASDNGGTANGGEDTSSSVEFTVRVNAELLFSDSFEG